ncbi:hypothetical protein ECANGB1_941 [Enterospora canceri]|uniref:Arrestin-like N-terminal domain-containing protein n=1 Tax=Enterospora canceri TaxID=1081671 RepID=A0A1Y1S763_9MICR|nr:hypothetical protein ECANGB1_941 [Enterospora canceri]
MISFVRLNNKFHRPGDVVTGHIVVQTKEKFSIEALELCFERRTRLLIEGNSNTYHDVDHDAVVFSKRNMVLDSVEISAGEHQFPFKFLLGQNEVSSSTVRRYFGETRVDFINDYIIYTICNGVSGKVTHLNSYQESEPSLEKDVVLTQSNFLCTLKRNVVKLVVDKMGYLPGELVKPVLRISKNNIKSIHKVTFGVYECFIHRNHTIRSRKIAETNGYLVDHNEIAGCLRLPTSTGATCKDPLYDVQIVVEASVQLHKSTLKIKKNLNVKQVKTLLPEKEESFALQPVIHRDHVINYY